MRISISSIIHNWYNFINSIEPMGNSTVDQRVEYINGILSDNYNAKLIFNMTDDIHLIFNSPELFTLFLLKFSK